MNRTQAQATRKIREAMSGLRAAMKTASPSAKKIIAKEIAELRSIKREVRAMDCEGMEDESMEYMEHMDMDPMFEDDDMDLMVEDDDMEFIDEDDDMESLDEDDMGFFDEDVDDEELAMSALDLAAAALKAAAEEDEDAEEDDSEDEDAEEDDSEDEDAEEDDEDAEEDDEDAEEDDEDAEEDDEDAEEDDEDEDGDLETLTEEELAALEKEGLLEGSTLQARRLNKRLARVSSRLNKLLAFDDDGFDDGFDDEMPAGFVEDDEASEYLSVAEVRELLAGMTPSERRDFVTDNRTLSARKRKKMSKSERAAAAKRAVKNRKLRKLRTKMKKSKKGMKGSINTPKGRKKVKKMFYFNTYDAKGKFLGSYWFTSNNPSKNSRAAYKKKYGVKHPADLTKVDDKRLAKLKEKRTPKRKR